MSGLYSRLFGENPLAAMLLRALGSSSSEVPRFCDCFLNLDGTEIIIYTRTGGGSRSDFVQENRQLRALSGFKRDDDDEFDQSYAIFRYDVPEQIKSMAVELASQGYGVAPSARWKDAAEKWATAKARSDG